MTTKSKTRERKANGQRPLAAARCWAALREKIKTAREITTQDFAVVSPYWDQSYTARARERVYALDQVLTWMDEMQPNSRTDTRAAAETVERKTT